MRLKHQLLLVSTLSLLLPWAGYQYIQETARLLRIGHIQALKTATEAASKRLGADALLEARLAEPGWREYADRQLYLNPFHYPFLLDGYADDWRQLELPEQHFQRPIPFSNTDALIADINGPVAEEKHDFTQGTGAIELDEKGYESTQKTVPTKAEGDRSLPLKMDIQIAEDQQRLLVFLRVRDSRITYFDPSRPELVNGDHVRLRFGGKEGRFTDYVFRSGAPGEVSAYIDAGYPHGVIEHRIRGVWQQTLAGFQLELAMPLSLLPELEDPLSQPHIGIAYVDSSANGRSVWLGNITSKSSPPATAGYSSLLTEALTPFGRPDLQFSLFSRNGWLLASTGDLSDVANLPAKMHPWVQAFWGWALGNRRFPERTLASANARAQAEIISTSLANGESVSAWFRQGQQLLGRVAVPVFSERPLTDGASSPENREPIGVLFAEQNSSLLDALSYSAAGRLLRYSLMSTLLSGLILLVYASWLTLRIRRLSQNTSKALDDHGNIVIGNFASPMDDELADLGRNFRTLLQRVADNTEYLRSLAAKLSHELRTPLAIMHSSLDNLEHEPLPEPARIYVSRAQAGALRLGRILDAMSSASRLQVAIAQAEREPLVLATFVQQIGQAYQTILDRQQLIINVSPESEGVNVQAAPELLAQLLDKLMENARDFSPEGAEITLSLQRDDDSLLLSLSNDGPLLPVGMEQQIFAPLVSVRAETYQEGELESESHLGLGLQVVSLIADYHGGQIRARNRSDHRGVCFTLSLPIRQ